MKRSRKSAAVPDIRKLRPKSCYSQREIKRRIRLLIQDPRQASALRRAMAITKLAGNSTLTCEIAHREARETYAHLRAQGAKVHLLFCSFYGLGGDHPQVEVYVAGSLRLLGGLDEDTGQPYLHATSNSYNARQNAIRLYDDYLEGERNERRARRKSPATMAA